MNYGNGPDSIQLRAGTEIVDAIGYGEFEAGDIFAGEGDPAPYPNPSLNRSLSRIPDGADTDANNEDFFPGLLTPGDENMPWVEPTGTSTQIPPTDTPTPTPSGTPVPPTFTPTPVQPTKTPSPTDPQLDVNLTLLGVATTETEPNQFIKTSPYRAGEHLELECSFFYHGPPIKIDLYIMFYLPISEDEVLFYFWPSWYADSRLDYREYSLTNGEGKHFDEIFSFDWPELGIDLPYIYFYAADSGTKTADLISNLVSVGFWYNDAPIQALRPLLLRRLRRRRTHPVHVIYPLKLYEKISGIIPVKPVFTI